VTAASQLGHALAAPISVSDLLWRFFIGGAVVSAFAGLFGAAPSVAIATLALTYVHLGRAAVASSARWMLIATFALLLYSGCCVWACRRRALPVWLGATAPWLVWASTACALWWLLSGVVST
jgi:hypothetical protein